MMNIFKPVLVLYFILIAENLCAGDPFVHIVIQEEPGKVLQYNVLYQEINRSTNPLVNYYWHSNGKMRSTRGDFSGNLLHGNFEEFDKSGRLTGKGSFFYGTKNGDWKFWNRDGELKGIEKWEKGFLQEKTIVTQAQTITEHYKNNQLHGKRVIYKNRKPVNIEVYWHGTLQNKERRFSLKSVLKSEKKKNKKRNIQ